jgi:hypothetical protein
VSHVLDFIPTKRWREGGDLNELIVILFGSSMENLFFF